MKKKSPRKAVSSEGTIRHAKTSGGDRKRHRLEKYKMETLGLGNMRDAVHLPEGEDLEEWFAVNIIHFYNQLSMLYSTITHFCTDHSCPVMRAGNYQYLWSDGSTNPEVVSARVYITRLLDWVNDQLSDEKIFPSVIGVPFPKNFGIVVKNIMRKLFRVYAHCFYHHLDHFNELEATKHLNTSFKHFIYFTKEFNLISDDQLEPLKSIITEVMKMK